MCKTAAYVIRVSSKTGYIKMSPQPNSGAVSSRTALPKQTSSSSPIPKPQIQLLVSYQKRKSEKFPKSFEKSQKSPLDLSSRVCSRWRRFVVIRIRVSGFVSDINNRGARKSLKKPRKSQIRDFRLNLL